MRADEIISIMSNLFDTNNALDNIANNANLQRSEIEDICEILLEELSTKGLVDVDWD